MFTLPPLDLPATFNPQSYNTQAQPIIGVQIQNNTAVACTIYSGGTVEDYLQPAGSYLIQYPLPTLNTPLINVTPTSNTTGTINVTVYQKGDTLPNVVIGSAPTTVNLASGATVDLASGATVNLASGSSVNINTGTVQVENVPEGVVLTYVKSPPSVNIKNGTAGPSISGASGPFNFTVGSPGASGGWPTGFALGNLIFINISIYLYTTNAPQSGNITITPPSGWSYYNTITKSFTSDATVNTYIGWCFWKIATEADITESVFAVSSDNYAAIDGVNGYAIALSSGSNNAFSNQSLTGLVSGSWTWTNTGGSNSNLVLPSTSPGVMVASMGYNYQTVTTSIGAIDAGGSNGGFWIATSLTGECSVQTSANPENNSTGNDIDSSQISDTAIIVPQ